MQNYTTVSGLFATSPVSGLFATLYTCSRHLHFHHPSIRPAMIFFVKKPKIFEKVKNERAEANFQARVNHNFQKFSDLRHKKHVCWINHYNEHDTTLFYI